MTTDTACGWLFLTFFSTLSALVVLWFRVTPPPPSTLAGSVQVTDADTLIVDGHRVRLAGIDAPEGRQHCRRAGEDYPCGLDAAIALGQRLRGARRSGARVSCTLRDPDYHQGGLGTCYASDGTALNGWLVEQGWALAYRRYSDRYVPQEARARAAGAGLWAGQFVPPWAWRAGQRLGGEAG